MEEFDLDKISKRFYFSETEKEKIQRELNDMVQSADQFLLVSSNKKTYIPNFVNTSFACELYLKAILLDKTNNYDKGHNLEVLFNYVEKFIDINELLNYMTIAHNEKEHNFKLTSYIKDDLDKMLIRHKNLFECWRYIFEGKVDNTDVDLTLISFAEGLKTYIHNSISSKTDTTYNNS